MSGTALPRGYVVIRKEYHKDACCAIIISAEFLCQAAVLDIAAMRISFGVPREKKGSGGFVRHA